MMIVQQLRIEDLHVSKDQVRTTLDDEALDDLARSLKERGQEVPIKVKPNGDGYEIIFGHRRVAASERAGIKTIWAMVEEVGDQEALVQQILENEARESVPYLEKARGYRRLLNKSGSTIKELAKMIGVPEWTVADAVAVIDGHEEGVIANTYDSNGEVFSPSKTAEITSKVKGSSEVKRQISKKSNEEELTRDQLREVITAHNEAPTAKAKDEVIATPHPKLKGFTFEQELKAKSFKEGRKLRRKNRAHATDHPVVKEYTTAISTFLKAVDEATKYRAKFAPEAAQFVSHKHAQITRSLLNLERSLSGD
jgi:ParB/RepB/Spo0J family partition protein